MQFRACNKLKLTSDHFSLSPTPQTSIRSLVETTRESPKKSDENQLCNSPRNNTNSQIIKRDSPTTALLVDDVKKLEIHTSDPDLSSKFKNNSPLASSSNLSKPDPADSQSLRLCNNNDSNVSRKSEMKWHCMVSNIANESSAVTHLSHLPF